LFPQRSPVKGKGQARGEQARIPAMLGKKVFIGRKNRLLLKMQGGNKLAKAPPKNAWGGEKTWDSRKDCNIITKGGGGDETTAIKKKAIRY